MLYLVISLNTVGDLSECTGSLYKKDRRRAQVEHVFLWKDILDNMNRVCSTILWRIWTNADYFSAALGEIDRDFTPQ